LFSVLRALGFALLIQAAAVADAADTTLANGVFLVAKPGLIDPNFSESVVLITLPTAGGGPLGVIINRPLERRLSELAPEATKVPEKSDPIFFGGPVARATLLFLLRANKPPEHSLHVLADVYLSANPELLERLVGGLPLPGEARIYAGHAGWAPGQLQDEIGRGGWWVTPADVKAIFEKDPATVWPELVKRLSTRQTSISLPQYLTAVR
jgi:putative transcriptional regulator